MRFLFKLALLAMAFSYGSYLFRVEPNVSKDPFGAISRANHRIATVCERNHVECAFFADTTKALSKATKIGWAVVSGQGRLVYMPNCTTSSGRPHTDATRSSFFNTGQQNRQDYERKVDDEWRPLDAGLLIAGQQRC